MNNPGFLFVLPLLVATALAFWQLGHSVWRYWAWKRRRAALRKAF